MEIQKRINYLLMLRMDILSTKLSSTTLMTMIMMMMKGIMMIMMMEVIVFDVKEMNTEITSKPI